MTAKRPRVRSLDDAHERYAGAGQSEPPLSVFLAAHGHPLAGDYRVARERFDALSWACGFGQRRYLYADEQNQVQLTAPVLLIGGEPKGWGGFTTVDLRDPVSWTAYATAAAAAGFPAETRPNGHLGRWTVLVRDPGAGRRLREALRTRSLDWRPVDDRADFRVFRADRFNAIEAALLAALLPGWELDPYTPPAPALQATGPRPSVTAPPPRGELSLFDALFA
jgi:hypothetical protein